MSYCIGLDEVQKMRARALREKDREFEAFLPLCPPVPSVPDYKPPVGEAFREWLGPLGLILFFALLCLNEDKPPAPRRATYIEVATERCLYGDGDYESCKDVAYKYAEEKGLAW